MNHITNYIQERIETLSNKKTNEKYESLITLSIISELFAVLSKIEELRQEEIADARGESIFNDRD